MKRSLVLLLLLAASDAMGFQALRAGAAKVDITPDFPVALEGYSNPENRISEGIHDRLYARALVFESGGRKLVLLSCDLTGFINGTFPGYQDAILTRFKLTQDQLLLAGTHTHSGPLLLMNRTYPHPNNYKYTVELRDKLIGAVEEARRSLAPAEIAVGRGSSAVAANRRLRVAGAPGEKDRIVMARNPDGPADREVLVLKITRPDGTRVASMFDYACHSRSLNSQNRLISGDIFGIAEQAVEKAFGDRFVSAAFSGAAGDVDPWHVVTGFDESGGRIPETVRMGSSLGEEVVRVLKETRGSLEGSEIRTAHMRIELPGRWAERPVRHLDLYAARIGDAAFLGLNCELLTEIGQAIKAGSPFRHTFLITICNGGEGYLPPKHVYEEGGYEANITGFAPEAADLLIRQAVKILNDLR